MLDELVRTQQGLEIVDVIKRFGSKTVLSDVNLTVRHGEFFTIIGPSGCGKTTLLRIVSGFYMPDRGRISLGGQEVTSLPPWERDFGFVFQNYALWPNMTVYDNVAYGLRVRKKPPSYIRKKVGWALELVGLPGAEKSYPGQLSGGMQQRVAIARSIVIGPRLLLFDEPLSNLDAKLRVSLRKQIRDIQNDLAITTVYVTHDQEEALEISDRIAVMEAGRLQQTGTPQNVYETPANLFVAGFLGEANFIEGTIDESGYFVARDVDMKLPVESPVGARGRATLMIRPENVALAADNDHDWHLEGRVVEQRYLGSVRKLVVQTVGSKRITITSLHDVSPSKDLLKLRFEKTRVIPEWPS